MARALQVPKLGIYPLYPAVPPWLAFTNGKYWHVKPSGGSDGNSGRQPHTAFKTLAKAQTAAVANRNDIVLFYGEGNASALCTDYQAATLDWAKDMVHLIGVNSGINISPRSRVAFASDYDTASNLFTLSANSCYIGGMALYAGVAGTNPTGCLKVTGKRNLFERCHIAGIGGSANDIANAYSLKLDGAEENEFRNCVIGLFTIARGAQLNSEILFDTSAKENLFDGCRVVSQMSHATNHVLVEVVDATGIDAFNYFENTKFLYQSANYAVGATGVFRLPALIQGRFLVDERCGARSDKSSVTVKWDVNDRDRIVLLGSPTPAADTAGVGRLV